MKGLDRYLSGERAPIDADPCECSDPGCTAHKGSSCRRAGEYVLYRVDMHDATGTLFCDLCAEDADSSGLFTEQSPQQREDSAVDALDRMLGDV